MDDLDQADKDRLAEAVRRELRTIDPCVSYFAATLLGTDEGCELSFQSRWAGWADGSDPDKRVELRRAVPVIAENVARLWDESGRDWIAVATPAQLLLFMRLGGHALIAEHIARDHFGEFLEPHEAVPYGAVGFIDYEPDKREFTARRPTKKQRMRILERDGFRCQLCGERPSDNEHITLHVHHVRPFSDGGPTIDENLITLCHTCHGGLDPHENHRLFWLPGGHVDRVTGNYRKGVKAYRQQHAPMFDTLHKHS